MKKIESVVEMSDRINPIKFGPEWLRNLSCEPSSSGGPGREGPGNPTATSPGAGGPPSHQRTPNACSSTNASKILLAKLRYGREEMLALYDRQTAEAPVHLKTIEALYQPRGKPPYALNNTFEEETRDTMRGQSSVQSGTADRYTATGRERAHITLGITENRGRALSAGENRGRTSRGGYNRQTSVVRATPNWHGNQRNSYSGMPDDDPNQALRPWSNNTSSGLRPNNTEQPDWQTKQQQYRIKRQPSSNWRQQPNRDDGEEWRSADPARRPQEKWEWQEGRGRPNQENKSWHSNRRTWLGGENNEDPLPEWAMDNAEACGGTFDSSGAFHGYSNDDSNLPKNQEPAYTLARSQTHGSFARSKTVEEGSEEWWASEKAKKLSPKRFDASEIKFKKSVVPDNEDEKSNSKSASSATTSSNGHNTGAIPKNSYQASGSERACKILKSSVRSISTGDDDMSPENKVAAVNLHQEENKHAQMEDPSKENKFDSRSESDKSNKEKGNFKSVILTQNNSLREKHQNIAVTPTETPKRQANQNIMHFFDSSKEARQIESDEKQKEKENKLVEDILQMSLDDAIPSATMSQLLTNHSNSAVNSLPQLPNPSMQMRMASPLDGLVLSGQNKHSMQPSSDMQPTRLQSSMMQPIGITNSMLNASLGLPMPISNSGLPLQGMNPSLPNAGLSSQNMLASTLQAMAGGNMQSAALQGGNLQALQSNLQGIPLPGLPGSGMQVGGMQSNMQPGGMSNNGLQSGVSGLPGFPSASMPGMNNNNSLFNNMPNANDMSNHGGQNMFPMHGLQQSSSQTFNNSIFGSMMNQPQPPLPNMGMHHLMDQWFYEDPNKTIQGPFSSKDMYNWFRAGFFSPTLMVRRACEAVMRPLGTYGHVPFGQMDLLPPYPMSGGFDLRPQQSHDNMMNPQPNLGIDMESLWGQPANNTPAPDHMWMQSMNNNSRNDNPVNNLPMYFWDNQPTAIPTTPILPEDIKTEDEILAQMRASQPPKPVSPLSFLEPPATSPENSFNAAHPALDMEHLQKLIESEDQTAVDHKVIDANQQKQDNAAKADAIFDTPAAKTQFKVSDIKLPKDVTKLDNNGKPVKAKETATKSKKNKEIKKEEKREESVENKTKEEDIKAKARSAEPSPSKNKKEDKLNKKEIEKEKKEWIKEGFTIVKNAEKNKDKKKADEVKAAEEADRKKKEEEKLLAEEKKRQQETTKKQQEVQNQQQTQRQVLESVSKKAPWSASSQGLQANSRDGPTLAEIQRLEREKKLEQMKEQQQMMQLIAQQQAAALAREQTFEQQEVQTGLGWAKKIPPAENQSQTLAEIQAEARKQAAVAAAAVAAATAAASAAAREEALATPPLVNSVPWGTAPNGGATNSGFWDTPPVEISKPLPKQIEVSKPAEPKAKKKVTVMAPPKKENPPSVEFDMWCNNMLTAWRDTGIDIPTFVCFLKDIESPYEVKDYVKCYLGDTREAGDFARQFLERRSRMLRVGMVTPSDDLCSPAVAINPRTNSGSDYTEVKGKGKKTKKNKMFKVDARNILGFSVTASEDRINVGDIDSV